MIYKDIKEGDIVTNETHKKVWFIGNGSEAVQIVIAKAKTNGEAIRRAEELYRINGWDFYYCGLEVARCL